MTEVCDRFLATSSASTTILTTGPERLFSQEMMANFETHIKPLSFEAIYICPDPSVESKGFQSWNDFTR